MSALTTWRQEFALARALMAYGTPKREPDTSPVVAIAPEDIDLDREFDSNYGGHEGEPVLIWTEERVYFPVVYDGAEWLESAPRNPVPEGQAHVGGE